LTYCLSFATDESDFARISEQLNDLVNQQSTFSLREMREIPSYKQAAVDDAPLPRTMEDALRTNKSRAVVITETKKPFRVVDVSSCWEKLCGYTYVESKGKTLGELLQGPETNAAAATGLITQLLNGEAEAGTTLTNYTKSGRRFRNRIRVGPLFHSDNNGRNTVTHFVGVLQEVQDGM
jgi:PAS domain S-box-containing protein